MKTPPPGGLAVPVSMEDWDKLLAATAESGYTLEAWEIGSQAVHDWLARNSPASLSRPCTTGYQWKELFLPRGALLRTVFGGKHYHCIVEHDGLRFNGEPTSPSRFANAVGGVRRNAWRVIWVLFPNTAEWKLADSLRTKRRAPRRPASDRGARQRTGRAARRAGDIEEDRRHQVPQPAEPAEPARQAQDAAYATRAAGRQPQPDHNRPEHSWPTERRVAGGERRRQPAAGAAPAGPDHVRRRSPDPADKMGLRVAGYAGPAVLPVMWPVQRTPAVSGSAPPRAAQTKMPFSLG